MAGLDLTTFSAVLKTLYPDQAVQNLTIQDNPFWGMVKKVGDFYGQNMVVPFRYADPEGSRSRLFTSALNARTTSASRYAKVTITRGHDYGTLQIDRETMAASEDNKGAFLQARKAEVDGMLNALGRSIGISLFKDGSGIRGQISAGSNVGTTTISLAEPNDIVNFEYGQPLVATAAIPAPGVAATLRSAGAVAYVVGIDRDAGNITVSATVGGAAANWSTLIAAVAAGDYLMVAGDNIGFSSVSNSSAIAGLGAWLPSTAPVGGDNFFGLDRSVDATRLAGIRFTGTGLPIEEALIKCAARVARDGGRPNKVFMNYNQYSNIATSLSSKVRYTDRASGELGFQSYKLYGPKGELEIYADQNCPNGLAYMLTFDDWVFHHLRAAPHIVTEGNSGGVLQEAAADALQVRGVLWGQLACQAPGRSAVLTLDT